MLADRIPADRPVRDTIQSLVASCRTQAGEVPSSSSSTTSPATGGGGGTGSGSRVGRVRVGGTKPKKKMKVNLKKR